jgi:hypothetical protein
MRDYDRLKPEWVPYLMFRNQPNFISQTCHTDEHGFRYTFKDGHRLVYEQFVASSDDNRGIVVGGSLAFGVGATSDGATIPSLLNSCSNTLWFNFGGRAFNSTQELLLFLMYRPRVKRVLLLSGLNYLIAYPFSSHFVPILGSFVQDSQFYRHLTPVEGVAGSVHVIWHTLKRELCRAFRRAGQSDSGRVHAEQGYRRAIGIIERDLELWQALSRSMEFSLSFALQPSALWAGRVLSEEEGELFAILDARQGRSWVRIREFLSGRYERFRDDLADVCRKREISFLDCNLDLPKDGWLFCDRAHLTDEGNRVVVEMLSRKGCA